MNQMNSSSRWNQVEIKDEKNNCIGILMGYEYDASDASLQYDLSRYEELLAECKIPPCAYKIEKAKILHTIGMAMAVTSYEACYGHFPIYVEGPNGKPMFEKEKGCPFFFNFSHANNCVYCFVSKGNIGLDIEYVRPLKPVDDRLIQRFFSEAEGRYIGSDAKRFFEVWTAKEGNLKASGDGLTFPVDKMIVMKECGVYEKEINGFSLRILSEVELKNALTWDDNEHQGFDYVGCLWYKKE